MKIDADTLSAELTRELAFSPLEKALPPKLRYRFYKWLKQYSGRGPKVLPAKQVKETVEKAYTHMSAIKELKKNEVLTSIYDNGHIRMDFGGNVDQKVKDAAMKWAKRRGLRATEASIEKSAAGSPTYVVFGNESAQPKGVCTKFVKHSV